MTAAERALLVAIPTFRRPSLLADLVGAVRRQAQEVAAPTVRVALIDNDPEESARHVAAELDVEYIAEPEPGIAAARQRALDLAVPGELVVMIDDDLIPEAGWLQDLLATWQHHRAAVVMGFVRYVWPPGTDPLIAAGGFMRRRRFAEGTRLNHLATGNVLIDIDQVRSLGVKFDRSLGLAGGEDSLFGKAVLTRGGSIVSSVATARDEIPVERATWQFVRPRTIGHGQTTVHVALADDAGMAGLPHRAWSFLGGVTRWLVFTGWRVLGRLLRNVPLEAAGIRRSWFAIGRMQAALGSRDQEYAR